jgi:Putative peptidoglycan binding domain
MNTKRILLSLVTGAMVMGSFAIAAQDQPRAKSKVRVTKPTMTTTARVGGSTSVRTGNRFVTGRQTTSVRARNRFVTNRTFVTPTRNRVVTGTRFGTFGYPTYSYGYPYYSYGFGYPYYGYYPYNSFGYYPYDSYYPYDYSYGYYYSRPGYNTYASSSIVVQVQTRLARAGYYHGAIDGVMGPRTHYAIQAYERDHGLRVDGVISGSLLRNMGLRY